MTRPRLRGRWAARSSPGKALASPAAAPRLVGRASVTAGMTGQLAWPLDRPLVPELDDLPGRRSVERSHMHDERVFRQGRGVQIAEPGGYDSARSGGGLWRIVARLCYTAARGAAAKRKKLQAVTISHPWCELRRCSGGYGLTWAVHTLAWISGLTEPDSPIRFFSAHLASSW